MMRTVLPFVVFFTFLGLWTWKLLEPYPVPESIRNEISDDVKFWLGKSLHAGAYAFLTVLAAFLPDGLGRHGPQAGPRRPFGRSSFWAVVAGLAVHGVGTEIGQLFVPNRTGSVRDVLIDWSGIGLGLLVLWAIRAIPLPSSAPPTPPG